MDNVFEILIKFGLSKEAATQAVAELKKIEEQTKTTGKEGVKQEEQVTEATNKTFTSKKQLKDMLKQIGHEFPLLGQVGRLALNPIAFTTAAIVGSLALMKTKFDEAVKASGGFELPNLTEDVTARYERLATASAQINTNLSGIATAFSNFEKNKDIIDAFARGFGNAPDDSATRAQAAREAGDRATAEAARLRGISGPFNPNNAAAGDPAKMLPALQQHRDEVLSTLNFINEGGKEGSQAAWAAKYLLKFGLTSPTKQAGKYQSELSQTDAQIQAIMDGGKLRAMRGGAFAGANAAEAQAGEFYGKAAAYSAAGAGVAGQDLKRASDALASGAIDQLVGNIIKLADAATRGQQLTAQALKDSDAANKVQNQKQ